jgi:ADP-heptose:LPS heptosyltransferase
MTTATAPCSLPKELGADVRRIAVVRALQIGDMLTVTPALQALRHAFPKADITLIGLPWARDLANRLMSVDHFVEFPGFAGIPEADYERPKTDRFLRWIRAARYDLAVQLHGDGTHSNGFVTRLGAHWTLGYEPAGAAPSLHFSAPYPTAPLNEIERPLHLLEMFGIKSHGTHMEFPLRPDDHEELERNVHAMGGTLNGPLIGLLPGARSPSRRWPAERFAAVADALRTQTGAQILVLGGPGDERLGDSVVRAMQRRAVNVAGRLSLGASAALINQLDLLITNDTGPSHIARALDTPSVVLFGPGDYSRWRPLDEQTHRSVMVGVACSPCFHRECPIDHRCMRGITVAAVTRAARDQLARGRSSAVA